MPELPEVETVRRGLAPVMEGAVIRDVMLRRADLRFPFPEDFSSRIAGRRVVAMGRRAKYLLADLEGGMVVVMHLGMSGAFRIERVVEGGDKPSPATIAGEMFRYPRSENRTHDHVVFSLDEAVGTNMRIVYNDPRRFGFMTLVPRDALDQHPYFVNLGLEPTGNALDAAHLASVLQGKIAPLKAALLDQRNIAGLGNIYVCEALHRAGLSPRRASGTLVTGQGRPGAGAVRLATSIREVIDAAIAAGGSTLRDHRQADGELGYFQHSFLVYGREGEACPRSGCRGTVARITQSGRSTFFCPQCQR